MHGPQSAEWSRSGGGWAQLRNAVKISSRVIVVVLGLAIVAYGVLSLDTLFWLLGLPVIGFGMALVAVGVARLRWGNVVVGVGFAVYGAGVAGAGALFVSQPKWWALAISLVGSGLAFVGIGVAFTVGGLGIVGMGIVLVAQTVLFSFFLIPLGVTLVCYGVAALR